jgi:hypothetical protein
MYESKRSGQKFGNLQVIGKSQRESRHSPAWFCRCDCGSHRTVEERRLMEGVIIMCMECELKKEREKHLR